MSITRKVRDFVLVTYNLSTGKLAVSRIIYRGFTRAKRDAMLESLRAAGYKAYASTTNNAVKKAKAQLMAA